MKNEMNLQQEFDQEQFANVAESVVNQNLDEAQEDNSAAARAHETTEEPAIHQDQQNSGLLLESFRQVADETTYEELELKTTI